MTSMVANRNRGGQSLVLTGVDPETCMIVFKNHWAQVCHTFYFLYFCGALAHIHILLKQPFLYHCLSCCYWQNRNEKKIMVILVASTK